MQALNRAIPLEDSQPDADRRGNIIVLAALVLVMVFGFTAFAVDLGYITLAKAEIQKSADAAALAATVEMYDGYGTNTTLTAAQVLANARTAAVAVAAENKAGGLNSVYLDGTRDVRLGQYQYNAVTDTWSKNWGVSPYNLVEVTVHRDQTASVNGDRPLDLFFAPVIGRENSTIVTTSTSAMMPGVGVKKIPGINVGILPIALDLPTWNSYIGGSTSFGDSYKYNITSKTVSGGADGVREVNIYPNGSANLPPGNRGTVDIGNNNNSTADLTRQILYGLNDADMEALGGAIDFENDLPMTLNGDTGLSAGIKDDLEAIKGQPRLIPIFSAVSGPGNNAMYTIVKFVPIRIVYVKLTGSPSSKQVIVQTAPYYSPTVVTGEKVITTDTIFGPASLVK